MKILIPFFFIAFLLAGIACNKDPEGPKQPKPIYLPEKASQVVRSSNDFGIDLFTAVAREENTNLMLSPLSASTALTMLLNGCNANTYDQLRDMLGFEDLSLEEINSSYNSLVSQLLTVDPEVDLALANAVWYRQGFIVKDSYLMTMDSVFDSETGALDFSLPEALSTINGWASDNTNGKIPKVLDEIDPDMVMFLMNALYFKGNWTYQFEENQTSDLTFYPENGAALQVRMMRNMIPARTYSSDGAICVELPYGRQNFAMVFILPDSTLSSYIQDFDGLAWAGIAAGLDSFGEPDDAEVIIPKFKFEYEKTLNDQLKALGMIDAFDPYMADLSGIADADIYVDFVKQNTFVDVNEEGTEAAAVTTIGIKETSMPPSLVFDRPFIFAIRERTTNSLLFIGKVESPVY